jgi:hypothetical protein
MNYDLQSGNETNINLNDTSIRFKINNIPAGSFNLSGHMLFNKNVTISDTLKIGAAADSNRIVIDGGGMYFSHNDYNTSPSASYIGVDDKYAQISTSSYSLTIDERNPAAYPIVISNNTQVSGNFKTEGNTTLGNAATDTATINGVIETPLTIKILTCSDCSGEINNALSIYDVVQIGESINDTFIIREPIYARSNKKLIINGYLQSYNYNQALAANASSGQPYVTVTDASQFRLGEYVAVIDDASTAMGGVACHTTVLKAYCDTIVGIVGNVIQLATNLNVNYTTANNAKLYVVNSIIASNSAITNFEIDGNGMLDGNKAGRLTVWAWGGAAAQENVDANCAISLGGFSQTQGQAGTGIKISNIKIKNAQAHGINIKGFKDVIIEGVNVDLTGDKSILVWNTINTRINKCNLTNAYYEDGITLYQLDSIATLTNNYIYNCGRYGILSSGTNSKVYSENNKLINNGCGIYISSNEFKSVNDYVNGGGNIKRCSPVTKYAGVYVSSASYIDFINLVVEEVDSSDNQIHIQGASNYVNFIGGGTRNSKASVYAGRGLYMSNSGGNYPANCTVEKFDFYNLKIGFQALAGVSNIFMPYCNYISNTNNEDAGKTTFIQSAIKMFGCNGVTGTYQLESYKSALSSGVAAQNMYLLNYDSKSTAYTTGDGLSISMNAESATNGTNKEVGRISAVYTDAAAATATSKLVFGTINSNVFTDKLEIQGDGTLRQVANIYIQDSLNTRRESSSIADDGTITLAAGQSGWGTIFIDSAGVRLIQMEIAFEDDGTTYINQSFGKAYITTATTDTNGKVCFYDGGTSAIIKPRLGYRVTCRIVINYATN